MRRIAAIALVVGVVFSPSWAFAQSDHQRPTPVEVAGAMMPCIEVVAPGGVWIEGGKETAMVYAAGPKEMFYIENTHASPPVRLHFTEPDPGRLGSTHVLERVERDLVDFCFREVLHR